MGHYHEITGGIGIMAGVYIKGMKMPEKCEDCRFLDGHNNGCRVVHMITLQRIHQKKPGWCPLVEVPDHGDLVDRDALEDTVMRLNFPEEYPPDDSEEVMESWEITRGQYKLIDNVLFQMPVVILAERSEK